MKRLIALFLLAALLAVPVLALVGCPADDPNNKKPIEPGTKTFIDNLGDRNYDGDSFTVSYLSTYSYEVYGEEDTTDVLEEAVYKRNRAIEDRFNVQIVPDETLADATHTKHINYIQNCFNGGSSDTFDISLLFVYKAGILVLDQMVYELREWVPYVKDALNNGSEWWSEDINNAFTVRGKQYVGVSDYCVTAMSMTYAMIFNKQYEDDNNVASRFGKDTMYDIVRSGNWTMDTFRTMVKDIGEDIVKDDNLKPEDDFFGFLCDGSTALDQFAPAMNINYVINDGEMTPELFTVDTRVERAFTALYDLFYGPGNGAQTKVLSDVSIKAFTEDRCFIVALPIYRLAEESFHEMDSDFGIIPYPKLDTNQKEYYSGTVDNYSVISILAVHDVERMEFIGTMIEALSAETHNSVEQPYYDLIVTHNSTRDEESIEMIEIIMKGRLYDFATLHYTRLYYDKEGGITSDLGLGLLIRNSINDKISDISSFWVSINEQVQGRLDGLVDEYVNMY